MQDFFFVRIDGRYIKVEYSDIVYIEGRKNYVKLVTCRGEWLVLANIKQMEIDLPENLFCRVHRSWIVCLKRIDAFDNDWVYIKEKQLPIGESYKSGFLESIVILKNVSQKRYQRMLCEV